MARIAGVDIPRDKRIEVALTYIYGIGKNFSKQITAEAGIDPNKRTNTLTDEEIAKIRDIIEKVTYYRNLEKRKEEVLKNIEEQGKLTEELKNSILNAIKLQVVEDLYLPYKKKKKTKADIAKDHGLEPLSIFPSAT